MQFRIADTFAASLAKLTNNEQKAVKTTCFDLQVNLASSGMRVHKLDQARDALRAMIQGKDVVINTVARDKFGRSVANVQAGGKSVNRAMKRKLKK